MGVRSGEMRVGNWVRGVSGRTAQVAIFEKKGDLCHFYRGLEPAWLRDFFSTVGAQRAYIWGKGTRQRPHINGSGQRPTVNPLLCNLLNRVILRGIGIAMEISLYPNEFRNL
jgi:hypothetical protein